MKEDGALVEIGAAQAPLVLAIDVGSSSARVGLLDAEGRRVAGSLHQTPYHLLTAGDGTAVLDPDELAGVVEGLIDHALASASERGGDVRAVGLSTFWHGLLGLDDADRPVTPVYTWADTRAADQVPRLRARLDAGAYHRRTGCILHPSYWPAKLLWLQACQRDLWSAARRWVSIGDYFLLRFCGGATSSISMASGTGLFDERRQAWDEPTLDAVRLDDDRLLPLSDEPQRSLRSGYAARWPGLAEVPWYPPLGDGACSNLGSGAAGQGRLGVTVGTTGAMRLLWAGEPVDPPPGLWLYRLDGRRVLLGGALSEGGNLYEWVSSRLKLPVGPALIDQLARMAPDSHQLTWLPFLAGERSPGWRGEARAVIAGLTLDTDGVAVLRAGLEAVALRFMLLLRAIHAAAPGERTIVASGAALLQDRLWVQILADALGAEVIAPREREAAFRGAGLVALERLGALSDLDRAASEALDGAPRYSPNLDHHRRYREALARQEALYRAVFGGPDEPNPDHSSASTL